MQPARELLQNARKNILIVENDGRVLGTLEALAGAEGCNIRTTWSGREALALIQSQPFDHVLVADHLPDIYCGEFVRMASRHARSIVVMHSGKPLPTSLRRYKALGATIVVDKDDTRQLQQLLAAQHIKATPA